MPKDSGEPQANQFIEKRARLDDKEFSLRAEGFQYIFTPAFEKVLEGFTHIARERGYEKMGQAEAFEAASVILEENGFENSLTLSADGIDASTLSKALYDEANDVSGRPDYSCAYDGGDRSSAQHEFYSGIRAGIAHPLEILSLKPIMPVRIDFDAIVANAVESAVKSLGNQAFTDAAEGERALTKAVEGIVNRAEPGLGKQHTYLVRKKG